MNHAHQMSQTAVEALAGAVLAGDWDRAEDLGRRLDASDTVEPALFLRVANILTEAGQIDAAEAWLLQGDRNWPDNAWLFEKYCRIGAASRSFDVAASRWQTLGVRHPNAPLAPSGLADLYRQAGFEPRAAALFSDTASRFADYVWAAHGDALSATMARDWAGAVVKWTALHDRFPEHDHAHYYLGQALMEANRLDEAQATAQAGMARFPANKALSALLAEIDRRAGERTVECFIRTVYRNLLHRDPAPEEVSHWLQRMACGLAEREFFRQMTLTHDYAVWHSVEPGHPPGHYYSPVVDPVATYADWQKSMQTTVEGLDGITLRPAAMARFWRQNISFMQDMGFAEHAGGRTRYYWDNGIFPVRDALILAAMINQFRPKRIVEVGSGFSTGVILDAIDQAKLVNCQVTCIDPYVDPSGSFLRKKDATRVSVLGARIQDAPLDIFDKLEAGDILFIDSTLVLKTGSDVHYEIFTLLPRLRPGVLVHFHDIDFPFEYNERWLFESRWSWNEAYILRAFLAYNDRFDIAFFNDFFFKANLAAVEADFPGVFPSWKWTAPGGSIWLTTKP